MFNQIVITREELYCQVWKEPLFKLCQRYGVSDNTIRKKCKLLNIPLPSNSYWGQLHTGKSPSIPPLEPHIENTVTFSPNYDVSMPKPIKEKEVLFGYLDDKKRDRVTKIYEKLKVQDYISNPHSLIVKHQEQYKKLQQNKNINLNDLHDGQKNYYFKTDYSIIDTSTVTQSQMNRTYLFLDALFKSLEESDCQIIVKNNFDSYVFINGFEIRFRVREKYLRVDNPEKDSRWIIHHYTYSPNGVLSFSINLNQWPEQTIVETRKLRMDARIKSVYKGFFDMAEKLRQREIKLAEEERKREEARCKALEIRKRNEAEKTRIANLIKDATNHNQAKVLRQYISDKIEVDPASEDIISWSIWANSIADWIDPIVEKNHEFLEGTYIEEKS